MMLVLAVGDLERVLKGIGCGRGVLGPAPSADSRGSVVFCGASKGSTVVVLIGTGAFCWSRLLALAALACCFFVNGFDTSATVLDTLDLY
jgi:hypothetical protein